MKIHIFEVSKSTGGVGQYIRWLANGVDRTRFQLTVACLSEDGAALAAELNQLPHVRAFSLEMARYRLNPFTDVRVCLQLARIIRRERFDIIHAHTSKPGFFARVAAAGTSIPVIYRPACWAFHPQAPWVQRVTTSVAERFAARYLTARIMTVCDEERRLAEQHHVGSDGQIVTVHTGVDPRPFDVPIDRVALRAELGVPADAPLVGTAGRLIKQKAPLDFVHAAAAVHQQRPDVHFVWVGNGALEAQVRAEIATLGLNEVFHLAGQRRDVPAVLQAFDCFVLPSHWEGFSLAVLEAMAARLPIVATRAMGTAEAVTEGENGFLVPIGAPEAMAAAVLRVVNDPEQAGQFGAASRERIEREFTRTRMIEQIEQLYDTLYAQRHHMLKNPYQIDQAVEVGSGSSTINDRI